MSTLRSIGDFDFGAGTATAGVGFGYSFYLLAVWYGPAGASLRGYMAFISSFFGCSKSGFSLTGFLAGTTITGSAFFIFVGSVG